MLLDLDRFKAVNDTCGHDAGDQLLKTVADRFRSCVREVDTVARMGGDEFAMILEGVSGEQDIVIVAQRIVQAMSEPFFIGGQPLSVGVSIGITVYPQNDRTVDELLKQADAAMYRAKQQGGNTFQFHPPGESRLSTVSSSQGWRPQA
jgi:diguanylate cyclase (GGDEF)-like protein